MFTFEIVDALLHRAEYRKYLAAKSSVSSTQKKYDDAATKLMRHSGAEYDLWGEFLSVTRWERSEMEDFLASRLVRKAEWTGADISGYSRERDDPYPQRIFSAEAATAIKRIIKLQRRQNWRDWAAILTPLVALLVGALGIVAALHSSSLRVCK